MTFVGEFLGMIITASKALSDKEAEIIYWACSILLRGREIKYKSKPSKISLIVQNNVLRIKKLGMFGVMRSPLTWMPRFQVWRQWR